jgi:hypothetical protein
MNICVNEIKYTSALKKKKATGNIKLQVMWMIENNFEININFEIPTEEKNETKKDMLFE